MDVYAHGLINGRGIVLMDEAACLHADAAQLDTPRHHQCPQTKTTDMIGYSYNTITIATTL